MLRNRCWKWWSQSLASSPGIMMFSPSHHGFTFRCNTDFVRRRGHNAASTEVLATVQATRAVCLLFSPELFIQSICVTLSLCNVMTETGECVLLSHLSTDGECTLQLPGVFSAFLYAHLPLAPCGLEHMPSPWGQSEVSLQPAQGWQAALTLLCLQINTVTFAEGSVTHQPQLPKCPTLELAFVFQTPKIHVSLNPSPGQTGNALDTMSIWQAISKDSCLEFLQKSQKL